MNSKNKSFNLLPMYKVGIGELIDGLAIKLPNYCKKRKIKSVMIIIEEYLMKEQVYIYVLMDLIVTYANAVIM
ncbi:hypothetical protein F1Z41_02985 [Clostridium perfringens]|nr:hypothetical protein [Clostridium perfringens]